MGEGLHQIQQPALERPGAAAPGKGQLLRPGVHLLRPAPAQRQEGAFDPGQRHRPFVHEQLRHRQQLRRRLVDVVSARPRRPVRVHRQQEGACRHRQDRRQQVVNPWNTENNWMRPVRSRSRARAANRRGCWRRWSAPYWSTPSRSGCPTSSPTARTGASPAATISARWPSRWSTRRSRRAGRSRTARGPISWRAGTRGSASTSRS